MKRLDGIHVMNTYVRFVATLQLLPLGPWTGGLWFGYWNTSDSYEGRPALLQLSVSHLALYFVTLLTLAFAESNVWLGLWVLANLCFIANHWIAFVMFKGQLPTLEDTESIYAGITLAILVLIVLPMVFKRFPALLGIRPRPQQHLAQDTPFKTEEGRLLKQQEFEKQQQMN